MTTSTRLFPEEEQLGWADLQLELQEALSKDKDVENARKKSSVQSNTHENLAAAFGDVKKLDQFIAKVNKQADSADELKELINNDKRRCAKVNVSIQERLLDLKQDDKEVDELILQCSSFHISVPEESEIKQLGDTCDRVITIYAEELMELKTKTQTKVLTIRQLQKKYEDLLKLKESIKAKEQENKLRNERMNELEAMVFEEQKKIEEVEMDLQKRTDETNKISTEIEAAERYLETLREEVQKKRIETEDLDIRKKELSEEVEKVQKRCVELEAMIASLNAKCKPIIDETNEWNSFLTRLQWDKAQRCQKFALNKGFISDQENVYADALGEPNKQSETNKRSVYVPRVLINAEKSKKESLNETFGTIIFDPVQLVSSTPIVSPNFERRKTLDDANADSKEMPVRKDNNLVKVPDNSAKTKRNTKKRSRPKGKTVKKELKPKTTNTKHPRCSNTLNAYDMLDSE